MKLNFLGVGSGFCTKYGNTSAYMIKDEKLILLDCGEVVFSELQKNNILNEQLKDIHIFITHFHSDHVGSLPNTILYCYYILGIRPTIHFPNKETVKNYLNITGVSEDCYNICTFFLNNVNGFEISYFKTKHVDEIKSYNLFLYEFDTKEHIYYSGDSTFIPNEILNMLLENEYKLTIYQDTCGIKYSNDIHMPYEDLKSLIPKEYRNKVYLIHYDDKLDMDIVLKDGFKIAEKSFNK